MNKDKIKDFIKKNKIAVGVTGTILVVGVLFGIGYSVHSLNKSDGSETNDMIVEANKNSETSKEKVSTTDTKNEDTKEMAINNVDNASEVNKNEQEDKTTSESNKTDEGNKNNGTSTDKQGTNSPTSKGESNKGVSNVSTPNNTNTSNNTGNTSSTHSHSWTPVKKTIHHKEQGHYENVLVKPAWSEKVPVYEERERYICNGCRKDITNNADKHMEDALLAGNTKCGAYHTEWKTVQVGTKVVKHDAVYKKKWVVDKKAYTETKITGYRCSCGATK
ncbi:hypothetical protein QJR26_09445 [Clostridium baratii]